MDTVHVKEDDLTNAYTYISNGEWFVENTKVELLNNLGHCGLFRGRRVPDQDEEKRICGAAERIDEELCMWDEFEIYDADGNEVVVI